MYKLNYRVALAPMAGVTDHAFRSVSRRLGAEFVYTEMLSAKALKYEDKKTAYLAELFDDDKPIAAQIFGSEPDAMAYAAARLADGSYKYCRGNMTPDTIDINMGCPAPKISGSGDGSALLRTPELAERIVRQCALRCPIPVTVKMRIGWDEDSICGVEFARRMEAAGAAAITVHGRTRAGRFCAPINFDELSRIKHAISVPMIANGEIFNADDAMRMFERTGCDAVMVGRGALGNPWIFSEIQARLEGREYTPPTPRDRIDTALGELRMCVFEKGEYIGVRESRKRLAWYLKGLRGAAAARDEINRAESVDSIADILNRLAESATE